MYFIYKEGVYGHGIFWIGADLDEAKRLADLYASLDMDDYHAWCVYEYGLLPHTDKRSNVYPEHDMYRNDARHTQVYTGVRTKDQKSI